MTTDKKTAEEKDKLLELITKYLRKHGINLVLSHKQLLAIDEAVNEFICTQPPIQEAGGVDVVKLAENYADDFYNKNDRDLWSISDTDAWVNRRDNFIEGYNQCLSLAQKMCQAKDREIEELKGKLNIVEEQLDGALQDCSELFFNPKSSQAKQGGYSLEDMRKAFVAGSGVEFKNAEQYIKSLPQAQKTEFELAFCEKCFQMTNHLNGICQKCKAQKTMTIGGAKSDGWVSVKDKLPELDQDVLIFCKPSLIKYPNGIYVAHRGLINGDWCNEKIEEGQFENVTHWHPLPTPPAACKCTCYGNTVNISPIECCPVHSSQSQQPK